jgi:hypothetical protein
MDGLREAGWDVEWLDEFDPAAIREALAEGRPPILTLSLGWVENAYFAHAVVVCAWTEDIVTVMDPLHGEYVEIPQETVFLDGASGIGGGFFIAGAVAT